MNDTLDKITIKKKRLTAEIEKAKYYLDENLNNFDATDYIFPDFKFFKTGVGKVFDGPVDAIEKLDTITRSVFSEDNILRKFFKYSMLLINGLDMVTEKKI